MLVIASSLSDWLIYDFATDTDEIISYGSGKSRQLIWKGQ